MLRGSGVGGVFVWATKSLSADVTSPSILRASASGAVTSDIFFSRYPTASFLSQVEAYSAITDANGYYSFSSLPAATYILRAERTGYQFSPENRTVTIPVTGSQDFTVLSWKQWSCPE